MFITLSTAGPSALCCPKSSGPHQEMTTLSQCGCNEIDLIT